MNPQQINSPREVWRKSGVLMAFLQRLILKRKPVLYGNCRRNLCSSLSAVPSDDDSSSSLPPQLPPFDYQPKAYLGSSSDKFLRKESAFWVLLCSITIKSLFVKQSCMQTLSRLNIVGGKRQYLFDESGRRYLDAFAVRVLITVVYFVNSGTEANELAMLMARLYSGNLGMIALRNAYHGGNSNRIGLTALNTWKYPIPQGEIHHVVNPDPYCGIFGSNAALYAKDVQDHIDFGSSGEVAAIQGVGGAVELAPGYLENMFMTLCGRLVVSAFT
ncbi:hypothetical protein Patl1_27445 [Pistacia atlantica]|uniref:Uncharacterized protein n=1 Tax=Pistacia atlantica TaxID=434234 RepID=A0ACC1BC34_9ROSI|nr:hypothetical protein Patl1_27445 [Pistacia atlantica]